MGDAAQLQGGQATESTEGCTGFCAVSLLDQDRILLFPCFGEGPAGDDGAKVVRRGEVSCTVAPLHYILYTSIRSLAEIVGLQSVELLFFRVQDNITIFCGLRY